MAHHHARGAVVQGSFGGHRPRIPAPAITPPPVLFQPHAARPFKAAPQSPAVQRSANGQAFQLPANVSNFSGGTGQPLPGPVREKMESFFGASFADVRVHIGPQASAIGALAFTRGSDLYFAQGQYNPHTMQGQQLLGHELAHVVQQRAGRVRNPFGSGIAVVQDHALEAEADRLGTRAASHTPPVQARTAKPVQPAMAGNASPRFSPPPAGAWKNNSARRSSVVQRVIGSGGLDNISRLVVSDEKTIGRIIAAERAKYMVMVGGPSYRPWIYTIQYADKSTVMVIESDPWWWLVDKHREEEYSPWKDNKGILIPLRSPVLQLDSPIEYVVRDGRMYSPRGTLLDSGKVAFVITVQGDLLIGEMHTGLSKGFGVRMAGELMIRGGVATYYSRQTGHYFTTEEEQTRGIAYMKEYMPWIQIDESKIAEIERPKSLFELFKKTETEKTDFSFRSKVNPTSITNQSNSNSLSELFSQEEPEKVDFSLKSVKKVTPKSITNQSNNTLPSVKPRSTTIYGPQGIARRPPNSLYDPITGQYVPESSLSSDLWKLHNRL